MYKIKKDFAIKHNRKYPLTKRSSRKLETNPELFKEYIKDEQLELPDNKVILLKKLRDPILGEECKVVKIPIKHYLTVEPIYDRLHGVITKIEKGKYEITLSNTGLDNLKMTLNRLDFCLDTNFISYAHLI